ncbi:MAG: D-alanyl-D-alanine carboxypeptidase/D-alanyl-D-alanine-endopeptidase [Actinomycetia bacterium]|nr:D-alanyl-D-alanine carboxypeptidase/D-alanyl-D-alanine-endopeptidase [Actinomycetes bacterium]
MHKPWIHGVAYTFGIAVVVALLVAPVPQLIEARDRANKADLAASTNIVQNLAAGTSAETVDIDGRLLTVRRVAGRLAVPVRERHVQATSGSIVADYPEPACLVVNVDQTTTIAVGTDEALIPASVQKVLTAIAALDVIGAETRFSTDVVADTVPDDDGVLDGDLRVIGGGDPMLAERRYADAYRRQPQLLTDIAQLVDAIVDSGVRRVRGDLLVDDSRYDTVRYVESWPERYVEQHNSGPIGALTVNDGFIQWEPTRVEADDPAIYFGQVLTGLLAEAGVFVEGRLLRGVAAPGVPIATVESAPVGEIVQQMLRESDNNTAESLLKEIGYRTSERGETSAGAEVVKTVVSERGIDVSDLVIVDGSGLDRGNRVACATLAALLDQEGPDSILGQGLAVAAESGTLGHRFVDTDVAGRLHAKTGLLNNVNALTGFAETLDGNTVTFAQLLNGIPLNSRLGIELQEDLAAQLVEVTVGASLDELMTGAGLSDDDR